MGQLLFDNDSQNWQDHGDKYSRERESDSNSISLASSGNNASGDIMLLSERDGSSGSDTKAETRTHKWKTNRKRSVKSCKRAWKE